MIKAYIKKISDFAQKNGIDHLRVLDNLMDYIIGFLSPIALVNKSWNYSHSQNESFYGLMIDYFKLCEIEMENHGWYDAWGDLFMDLKGNSAGYRNQFFTPPCVADLSSKMVSQIEKGKTDCKGFGFRATVDDVTCGSGRMLLAMASAMQKKGLDLPYLIGEDIDTICCKMAAVNIAVHGFYGEVICHNSLQTPKSLLAGYIINEGLYPSRSGLPTIRVTTNKKDFVFDFSEKECLI